MLKKGLKTPQNKPQNRPQNRGSKMAQKMGSKPQGVLGGIQGFSGKVVWNSGKVLCFSVKNIWNYSQKYTKIYTKNV